MHFLINSIVEKLRDGTMVYTKIKAAVELEDDMRIVTIYNLTEDGFNCKVGEDTYAFSYTALSVDTLNKIALYLNRF